MSLKYKYLVVNDNDDLRELFCEIFVEDAEVMSAKNGQEALDLMKAHCFDLVICDVNMPIMNGIEFCKQAMEADADFSARLIMVTGDHSTEIQSFCQQYGIKLLYVPMSIITLRTAAKGLIKRIERKQWIEKERIYSNEPQRSISPEITVELEKSSDAAISAKNQNQNPEVHKATAIAGQERRHFKRKQVRLLASIDKFPLKSGKVERVTILDISLGGIRFSIPKVAELEIIPNRELAAFTICFTLPNNLLPIIVKCDPKRVAEIAEEVQIGAAFIDTDFPFQKALQHYAD